MASVASIISCNCCYYSLHRKNPRGILISPGPGEFLPTPDYFLIIFHSRVIPNTLISDSIIYLLSILPPYVRRYAPRFRDFPSNGSRTWSFYSPVWGLYGAAVHWRSLWRWVADRSWVLICLLSEESSECTACRKDRPFPLWRDAWEKLSSVLWRKGRGWPVCWPLKVGIYLFIDWLIIL